MPIGLASWWHRRGGDLAAPGARDAHPPMARGAAQRYVDPYRACAATSFATASTSAPHPAVRRVCVVATAPADQHRHVRAGVRRRRALHSPWHGAEGERLYLMQRIVPSGIRTAACPVCLRHQDWF